MRSTDGSVLADVQVAVDGSARTRTDSAGTYTVLDLAAGSHEVRFTRPGFSPRTLTVLLADAGDLALDVELVPALVFLPPINVSAPIPTATPLQGPLGVGGAHELGQYRIAPGWQQQMLAQGADIQRALAAVPGVAARADDATSISIRGGSASENLTLLDGLPVYGGSHFGTAASPLNPDAIASIDIHTGVTSARFGGRLSGVLALETADSSGPGMETSGAVGASEVRSLARGSMAGGRGAFLLGARATFRDFWQADGGGNQETRYHDLIGVERVPLAGGSLRLVSYYTGNHLGLEAPATAPGPDDSFGGPGTAFAWHSTTVGGTWTGGTIGGATSLRAWYAGAGADVSWMAPAAASRLHSSVAELGATAELSHEDARVGRLVGVSLVRPATDYIVATTPTDPSGAASGLVRRAAPAIGSIYGEWRLRLGGALVGQLGVRGNSDFEREWNLEPRIDLTWRPSPATHVDLGAGRTHQSVQSLYNEENLFGSLVGLELPIAASANIPTAAADQVGLGVEHRLSSGVVLTLDGWLRRWTGVALPAASTPGAFITDSIVFGTGRASGLVGSAAYTGRRLDARASITLARSTRSYDNQTYAAGVGRPWSFQANFGYRLPHGIAAQVWFMGGAGEPVSITGPGIEWRPYALPTGPGELGGTPINLPGPVNIDRLPGYARLDLGVARSWPLGLGGRHGAITTSVRGENLLNRPNATGLLGDPAGGALRLLRGTPRGLAFELGWTF